MSDFKFEFGRHQISKIPREKIIAELEKVAKHFNYIDFKQDDFDKIADISHLQSTENLGLRKKLYNSSLTISKARKSVFK